MRGGNMLSGKQKYCIRAFIVLVQLLILPASGAVDYIYYIKYQGNTYAPIEGPPDKGCEGRFIYKGPVYGGEWECASVEDCQYADEPVLCGGSAQNMMIEIKSESERTLTGKEKAEAEFNDMKTYCYEKYQGNPSDCMASNGIVWDGFGWVKK
jgi:hypothetical protein